MTLFFRSSEGETFSINIQLRLNIFYSHLIHISNRDILFTSLDRQHILCFWSIIVLKNDA